MPDAHQKEIGTYVLDLRSLEEDKIEALNPRRTNATSSLTRRNRNG